jgi:hypothetical protein
MGLKPTVGLVGVDGDVYRTEAERFRHSCSVCSVCGVGWSPAAAIADVRRHVSWDHSGWRGEGNDGTQLCGFVQLSGGTSFMAMAIEQEIRVGMVGFTVHQQKTAAWTFVAMLTDPTQIP